MSLLPNFKTLKSLVLGSPPDDPLPSTVSASNKRKASRELPRKTKRHVRYSPYSPSEYQSAPYSGSVTMIATEEDDDTDDDDDDDFDWEYMPPAGSPPPHLQTTLKRSKTKTVSPMAKAASPDKVEKAAEAHKKYQSIGDSEAARMAKRIWSLEPKADTIAEHLTEAVGDQTGKEKEKEKQPVLEPILEFQPNIEDLSDFEDEEEKTASPPPTADTPIPSPSPLDKKIAAVKAKVENTKQPQQQQQPPLTPKTPSTEIETKPEGWDKLTILQKWAAKPNLRAREIVTTYSPLRAKYAIARETKEPDYAFRDAEIRDALWQIMDQMERFAIKHFRFEYQPENNVVPTKWYEGLSPQTARVIGCVASGGPTGVHGWHDLFIDEQKRRALVCAIIGNVLVEQVFQHDFFGGRVDQIKIMRFLQEKYCNEDGFDRNKRYAMSMQNMLNKNTADDTLELPANFNNHVNHIVGTLWTHLASILRLNPDHPLLAPGTTTTAIPNDVFDPLHNLVTQAGFLSLHMRVDPHTVYYFEPVYKEDTFTAKRLECFNLRNMQQRHPRYTEKEILKLDTEEQERRATLSDAEKKRAKTDSPLTQITIMDGVTAYRPGGWEKEDSKIIDPRYEKAEYKTQGVRQRVLTHGWAYCRWGRPCTYKNGKPVVDGEEKVHGDAWNGGFVEFSDVKGVYPWLEMERKARKEATEEALQKRKANAAKGKGKERAMALDDAELS